MKKDIYQMSALNDKQMWLCDIMTRLPLIKYVDYLEVICWTRLLLVNR